MSGPEGGARLLGQTVLRADDGTRWVVNTQVADGGGFVTTTRRTGCDLTPLSTNVVATADVARRVHALHCTCIQAKGRPATEAELMAVGAAQPANPERRPRPTPQRT